MNPIKYTSNDYDSVMNDINSDDQLADRPEWYKRIWAGVRDVSSVMENAIANQSFLRTAFTRQAVADLCALIDYQIQPHSTSSGNIIFFLDSAVATFPTTFAPADMKAVSQGTLTSSSVQFEARTGETVAAVSESFTGDSGTDLLTVATVYKTGEKVRLTTTGALPAPLVINTDYYVIYVGATTIYLADTLAHAYQGTHINLTTNGSATNTIHKYCFTKLCYQQATISAAVTIGTGDATTEWQTFKLPDKWIIGDTLVITINTVTWTKVTSFVDSISTDTHYKLIYLDNGDMEIMFGDGTYGVLPGAFPITALYATGGGFTSNVSVQGRINNYAGSHASISGATNSELFTGGADEESLESAKRIAPMLLKARDRFVTSDDGKYLSENYAGVLKVGIIPNYTTALSVAVAVIPTGGGTASAGLKTDLETYLEGKTIMNRPTVTCIDPTYVDVDITCTVHLYSGWVWATVKQYVMLGYCLLLSECTSEILDAYGSNGIASAVAYINNKWSAWITTPFTTTDYNSIIRMLTPLQNAIMKYADFEVSFIRSDIEGFIDAYVDGVDYVIISNPSFPITVGVGEITHADDLDFTHITQV